MSSRLDRLFILLETGSTPVIRKSAAQQLGEVQRLHPHELHTLLSKVLKYLRASSWDTRVAAGQAIEAILRNVPEWRPSIHSCLSAPGDVITNDPSSTPPSSEPSIIDRLDIYSILARGASLLGSEAAKYDACDGLTGLSDKERIAAQKQMLNKRLGLDLAGSFGISSEALVSDEDLASTPEFLAQAKPLQQSTDVSEMMKDQISVSLSARQANVAKRKARSAVKQEPGEQFSNGSPPRSEDGGATAAEYVPPSCKKPKTVSVAVEQPGNPDRIVVDSVRDSDSATAAYGDESDMWPFESICEVLFNDLFHWSWEIRHGAATGLREVIKTHGKSAGWMSGATADELLLFNQLFLQEAAVRLLCVLALDRFGDYVSDEVVAPVRETCAQALGITVRLLEQTGVTSVLRVLLQVAQCQSTPWEARHGALLGVKYLLAARQDMTESMISTVWPTVLLSLKDNVDDVRAVAASCLLPAAGSLVQLLQHEQMVAVMDGLWNALLELDDLTSSTNSIMGLLSALVCSAGPAARASKGLGELAPRLFPFLRHGIASVRKGTLETLSVMLGSQGDDASMEETSWLLAILPDALRHIYQRCLLEERDDIQALAQQTWSRLLDHLSHITDGGTNSSCLALAAAPFLSAWMCLMMQPAKVPIDATLLISVAQGGAAAVNSKPGLSAVCTTPADAVSANRPAPGGMEDVRHDHYIGGSETLNSTPAERDRKVVVTRMMCGKCLGSLCAYVCAAAASQSAGSSDAGHPTDGGAAAAGDIARLLMFYLAALSAVQRMAASLITLYWAETSRDRGFAPSSFPPASIYERMLACLQEVLFYDEVAAAFASLQSDCRDLAAMMRQDGVVLDERFAPGKVVTLDDSLLLVGRAQELAGSLSTAPAASKARARQPCPREKYAERAEKLRSAASGLQQDQQLLTVRIHAVMAAAVVTQRLLPASLNPIIRPLMEAIKKEPVAQLQELAAGSMVVVLTLCCQRDPCPNSKVVKNLCNALCCDTSVTPAVEKISLAASDASAADMGCCCTAHKGILSLAASQKHTARGFNVRRRGPRLKASAAAQNGGVMLEASVGTLVAADASSSGESSDQTVSLRVQFAGAKCALRTIAEAFDDKQMKAIVPTFIESLIEPLAGVSDGGTVPAASCGTLTVAAAQELVGAMQLIECVYPSLRGATRESVTSCLDRIIGSLQSQWTAVRHMAARCLACIVADSPGGAVMNVVVESVLPLLGASHRDDCRQGAIEAIYNIVDCLGFDVAPYVALLIVPVLGCMSDQDSAVQATASQCFASLLRLMPLEGGIPNPVEMKSSIVAQKQQERAFLEQLLDGRKVEDYGIPVPIHTDLRKYQQDGVNWLSFLNKYKLHGILCDDMGLGKTLQSICILAADHHQRRLKHEVSQLPDCAPLPSIVICPPTLTSHWVYEIDKFVDKKFLNPLNYAGSPADRQRLRGLFSSHNLIVASYDIVRNDIEFFRDIHWNYCILDEGHIIKNARSKTTQAVKLLRSNHRLILTGTPVQNDSLELWSLFDFLMPGYLGSERQFSARYSRPILQSRDAKCSQRDQEAGALAVEALHKQVLPFLLRRMKEDVLQDLPPKIIQDYYCDLSPLQMKLYREFGQSRIGKSLGQGGSGEEPSEGAQVEGHVFQALQYLKKVCNHPALVLTPQHPHYEQTVADLAEQGSSLHAIEQATKLTVLRQLLLDCGIGVDGGASNNSMSDVSGVVNQHRALVFCQLKTMLDIVEKDLLCNHMPGVTYLRLDGSVPTASRHEIVKRFNADPSIDILLLTTSVGGLGLNLTGADTVIFVEHDWNPMKDLQAMDRAHRIGQKRVVNVYRLITKNTLEEKIMGLQKFKLSIANTVVNQDNSSFATMETDQLLDLFTLREKQTVKEGKRPPADTSKSTQAAESAMRGKPAQQQAESMRTMLQGLEDLWDSSQYETEYNLDNFMQSHLQQLPK